MSFGYARGVPVNADLVFDMRFLRNPHWDAVLRPGTGLDADVAAYVVADPAYAEAFARIGDLLGLLLPRYRAEGKAYVTVAFGCTGGRHRSVHVAEAMAGRLREAGFFAHGRAPRSGRRAAGLAGGRRGRRWGWNDTSMIGLVLVTHGRLADEFVTAMEHVVGKQERIATVAIGPDDDMEGRRDDIASAISAVDAGRGVIVLTDLFGGTPSNLAISLMERGRIEVIAGINLPMLIRLESARKTMKVVDAVAAAREAGRKYISVASEVLGEAAA